MTHKESYPDVGMITVVIPFATTMVILLIWSVLGLTS